MIHFVAYLPEKPIGRTKGLEHLLGLKMSHDGANGRRAARVNVARKVLRFVM